MLKNFPLVLLLILFSCTKHSPKSSKDISKKTEIGQTGASSIIIDNVNAEVTPNDVLLSGPAVNLGIIPKKLNSETKLVILNTQFSAMALNISVADVSPFIVENHCPALLESKRTCVVSFYFNTSELAVGTVVNKTITINGKDILVIAEVSPPVATEESLIVGRGAIRQEFGQILPEKRQERIIQILNPSSSVQTLNLNTTSLNKFSASMFNMLVEVKPKRIVYLKASIVPDVTLAGTQVEETFSVQGVEYVFAANVIPFPEEILPITPSETSVNLGNFDRPGVKNFSITYYNAGTSNLDSFSIDTEAPVVIKSTSCSNSVLAKRYCTVNFETDPSALKWAPGGNRIETLRIVNETKKSQPLTLSFGVFFPEASLNSLKINNNSLYTNASSVVAEISALNAFEMKLTNNSTCLGGTWVPYQTSSNLTLPLNQESSYSIKFRRGENNETDCISKNIIHDDIAPVISFEQTEDLVLNQTAPSVNHSWNFTAIEVNPESNYSVEFFSNESCLGAPEQTVNAPFSSSASATKELAIRQYRTVKISLADKAGNSTSVCSKSVTYGHPSLIYYDVSSSLKVYETPVSLTGKLKDIYNNGISGFPVQALNGSNSYSLMTDSSGNFSLPVSSAPSFSSGIKVFAPTNAIEVRPVGYNLSATRTIQVVRRSCQELALYDSFNSSGAYVIDSDQEGVSPEFSIDCNFETGIDLETVAHSTITNREKVSRSLKAVTGIERVLFDSILLSPTEVNSDGKLVYSVPNDPRFKFIGTVSATKTFGGSDYDGVISMTIGASALEVVFFGTGLNVVAPTVTGAESRGWKAYVDGVYTKFVDSSAGTAISNRKYKPNQIFKVVNGLPLGWHTVRLSVEAPSTGSVPLNGVEIINERSDVYLSNGGVAVNALKNPVTSNLKDGVVGTKGARIVKYLENGEVKSQVTEVNASIQLGDLADHSNEEVAAIYNYQDFGKGRADDFSTISTTSTDRAFTLDDGTTTLACDDCQLATFVGVTGLQPITDTDYVMITFIGTGLDVIVGTGGTVGVVGGYSVDGGQMQSLTYQANTNKTYKIASGLPYGTHTVKLAKVSVTTLQIAISDFIIYQPKKPSIPVGSVEIADYNILANYTSGNRFNNLTNAGFVSEIAQGVIRKQATREMVFAGTWSIPASVSVIGNTNGFEVTTTQTNAGIRYTFFGTGFFWGVSQSGTGVRTMNVKLNGAALPGGINEATAYGLGTKVSAGNYSVPSGARERFLITGLPLGVYTVDITNTSASGVYFYFDGLDIITPVHTFNNKKSYPISCLDALQQNSSWAGMGTNVQVMIDPDGEGGSNPIYATCDMNTSGGGWTQVVDDTPTLAELSKWGDISPIISTFNVNTSYGMNWGANISLSSLWSSKVWYYVANTAEYSNLKVTLTGFYDSPTGGYGRLDISRNNNPNDDAVIFSDGHSGATGGQSLYVAPYEILPANTQQNVTNQSYEAIGLGEFIGISMKAFTGTTPYTKRYVKNIWVK